MLKIAIIGVVTGVAAWLAASVGAPVYLIYAIGGGSAVGIAINHLPEKFRTNALMACVVIAAVTTGLGGLFQAMVQAEASQFSLWALSLGLAIGGPIGYFFGKE